MSEPEAFNPMQDDVSAPTSFETKLRHAPLVRVIAQLHFPMVVSIDKPTFIAGLQEALRDAYPVLRRELTPLPQPPPDPQAPPGLWRFADTDGVWRISLCTSFVALETSVYAGRKDFLQRLGAVLAAMAKHIRPARIDRLGVRYVNRLTGGALGQLQTLLRPEITGIATSTVSPNIGHVLCDASFDVPEGRLSSRTGRLPAGATLDPTLLEPMQEPSWVMDYDLGSTKPVPFSVSGALEAAEAHAKRIYAVFRWSVTPQFIERYRG